MRRATTNSAYQAPWSEAEPAFYSVHDKPKKRPKTHVLATVADWFSGASEGIFSDHGGVIWGVSIAGISLSLGILGYAAVVTPIAVAQLGSALGIPFGWAIGATAAISVQFAELFPRRHRYFPRMADKAVFRLNRQKLTKPTANPNAPAAHLFHHWAKWGTIARLKRGEKLSWIAYGMEAFLAFAAVGTYFSTTSDPVLRLGALLWGAILVAGCEIGLAIADTGSASRLTAKEEQLYALEQQEHAAKVASDAKYQGTTIDV